MQETEKNLTENPSALVLNYSTQLTLANIKKNPELINRQDYETIILDDESIREGIKVFSNWPTIPQLYIKKEFVGGCDIMKEMAESGELIELFNTRGIKTEIS